MKAFIVYCHPSEDSFTRAVRDAFVEGVADSGNESILSDLYKMGFKTDMTEEEYLRDASVAPRRRSSSSSTARRGKTSCGRRTGMRTFEKHMK